MKIAVPSTAPDMGGAVESRLGTAAYLLVIDSDDMSFEAVPGPPASSGPGAGVQAVSLVVGMGATVLLVDTLAPHIAGALRGRGIDVQTRVTGTVAEVVAGYLQDHANPNRDQLVSGAKASATNQARAWLRALASGARQFLSLLPMMLGVIFLLGLLQAFVSDAVLQSFFSGLGLRDALWGAAFGSVMIGNPVNSYIIGQSLLESGVGMAGAAALMLAWINVGMVQLPAEAAALGWRFALVRNAAGFCLAVVMGLVLALCLGGGA